MSSRRSRQSAGTSSRITDDQINDLVSKLQQLLPEIRNRRSNKVVYHLYLSVCLSVSLRIFLCVHIQVCEYCMCACILGFVLLIARVYGNYIKKKSLFRRR